MQLLGKGNQHDWTGSNRIFRGPGLVREEPDSIPSPCKFQVATAMAEQSGRMCGRFNSERLDTFATKFEIGRVTTSDQLSYRRCWTYRWFGKEAAKPHAVATPGSFWAALCCPQADPNFHNFGGWSTAFKNTIVEKKAFDFVCTWASFCHLTQHTKLHQRIQCFLFFVFFDCLQSEQAGTLHRNVPPFPAIWIHST